MFRSGSLTWYRSDVDVSMVSTQGSTRVDGRDVLLLFAILSPALIWILLDRAPFSGDEAVYGRASAALFRALLASPLAWAHDMFSVLPYKPNALVWVGQFFVPLGYLLGSVDAGLMLSVWLAQFAVLVLVYRATQGLADGDAAAAVPGTLVIASAPIFVLLGGFYLVESIQAAAVAWFVLIAARAGTWSPAYTLCHLLAASAFATLTKTTTPVFCVGPALLSLGWVFARSRVPGAWAWRAPGVPVMAIVGVLFSLLAATWYYRNWTRVIAHVKVASSGPVAALWGKEDTFLNTLAFWLQESARSFFLVPAIALPVLLALIVAAVSMTSRSARFDRMMLVSVLQMATVLCAFGFSANRTTRYLLPLAPYVGLVASWSIHRIGRGAVRTLGILAALVQLALVQAIAFGIVPNRFGAPVRALDRDGRQAALLEAIVARTCRDTSTPGYVNVLAIDPSFRGDWLAPEPAGYVAERNPWRPSALPLCNFHYAGGNFFGASAADTWRLMIADPVRYVITADPAVYAPLPRVWNTSLDPRNFGVLWANLTTTGHFKREPPLAEDPGIAIFRRVDQLAGGRALSDQGLHEQAIPVLRRVAAEQPSNVEAWANLALVYERAARFADAVEAGERALALNPGHYYVNLGLARVRVQRHEWKEAIVRGEAAAANAPSAERRADALLLAARASFRGGDRAHGCDLLRQVSGTPTDREILTEMSTNGCGR
jgi:hypothetical protein